MDTESEKYQVDLDLFFTQSLNSVFFLEPRSNQLCFLSVLCMGNVCGENVCGITVCGENVCGKCLCHKHVYDKDAYGENT